ncbi:RNA polymerase III transcription initiation factor complex subunit [Komagataella phaffii CBS 7435]|uniref:One of six subunits of the RNA polymerase III transcription initiation factor complex (TFIIIC) n=2 Tax=Komagataella phaffii TaxID=460519 RepID=C4R7P6_KOMPG|nr:One of six subunits of the RNA polymerase III transcription initiation factor complex (TFIIIC) [Komagataella phaffii GS115]CAH2450997.1 RNA polymerase III transcription initiation factor complex subunit [Komagataella phaffii CBS 7435]CAY71621.1 One of six subunits of the RNA polymerase III transcription initiation factor complex (TFIIIC) [Komagataella phaffii GS115]CCA40776.1 RNA polymerase III transcription initiation factor complex subunit [Komagataella phaffii CBS 7435]
MALKNIFIARHGFRSNWLPPPHPVSPTGIDSDSPLAEHGIEQAHQLASYLVSIDPKPDMILTSPFYRCIETSQPIAESLDIDICLDRGVGEWYKKDRPTIPQPASVDALSKFFPKRLKTDIADISGVVPSALGESEDEILARCQEFWRNFIPQLEKVQPQVENLLIVTHAATKIALIMSLLGYNSVRDNLKPKDRVDSYETIQTGSCSLSKLTLNSSQWELKMNGMTDFLTNGTEMNWNFTSGFEAGSDEDIASRKAAAEKAEAKKKLEETSDDEYEDVYFTLELPSSRHSTLANPFDVPLAPKARKKRSEPKTERGDQGGEDDDSEEGKEDPDVVFQKQLETSLMSNIEPTSVLQMSGLETSKPLIQINESIFQGRWVKVNGTEMIYDDSGELVAKVDDRIQLTAGKLKRKEENPDVTADQEMSDLRIKSEKGTTFLSEVLNLADHVDEEHRQNERADTP